MMFFLYSVHVLTSLILIAVVLLQQGKGADLSVFGGGATQTAFGARGAAHMLHKMTVAFFVIFIATTLSIGLVQKNESAAVLQSLPETVTEEAIDEPPVEEAGALPTGDASDAATPEADGELEATDATDAAAVDAAVDADADLDSEAGSGDQPAVAVAPTNGDDSQ